MVKEITKPGAQKRAAATVPSSRILQAKSPLTPAQRQIMICEAAYYIAEHRGFEPGHDMDDWLAAEQQIDGALTSPGVVGSRFAPASPTERG